MQMKMLAALIGLLLAVFAPALRAQDDVDCAPLFRHQEGEAALLKTSPHGASRPTVHRLVVAWSHGKRDFVDKAPYLEGGEEGMRHLYCGYDRESRMHVIYKADDQAGYGVLL